MGVRTAVIAGGTDSAESFRLAACGLYVPASQINSRTGVTSTPVLTGTGSFTCTIGPFSCVVDGTSNSLQGSYGATLDTSTTVTINAASTQARIDLISLQIQDNAYDGSGVNAGRILYTAGTPGSGAPPTAPANSISLWTVPVAANASSVVFSSATAVFPYTAAAGGVVPARSAADKPAVASGVQYRHRLDVTAGSGASPTEWSTDGVTYTPVYDPNAAYGAWTNAGIGTNLTVWSSSTPQYRTAPGGRVELRGSLQATATLSSLQAVLTGVPSPSLQRNIMPANTAGNYLIVTGSQVEIFAAGFPSGQVLGFDGLSYTL